MGWAVVVPLWIIAAATLFIALTIAATIWKDF